MFCNQVGDDVIDADNFLPTPEVSHNYSSRHPDCSIDPPKLVGYLAIDVNKTEGPNTFDQIHKMSPALKPGGRWCPAYCKPRNRVAIVIPYRYI